MPCKLSDGEIRQRLAELSELEPLDWLDGDTPPTAAPLSQSSPCRRAAAAWNEKRALAFLLALEAS
jgi:hypothetical protein